MERSKYAIEVEHMSKQYRLGEVGTGTISHDLNRWWHKIRGKEDPYKLIGDTNVRSESGDSEYVWALKDIDFKVERGEVLGIIGKNGAGKSTLLKILSKVTGPSTGRITMRGRVASLLEVGTGFHNELTGRENIYLNGAILGMTKPEITRKLDAIVDFAGVAKYIDTPVKRYSSGMKVRLGFAVAAHLEPEILIVDEVLAVGDFEFQKKAVGKMQEVTKGGDRTVLFVSHNLASVQNLCTRCMYLSDGTVKSIGGTEEIVEQYSMSEFEGVDQGSFDLRNVKRKGNGLLKLTTFELKNAEGRNIEIATTGQNIQMHLKYKIEGGELLNNVNVFIGVYDSNNTIISAFNNEMTSGQLFSGLSQSGTFQCTIPKLHIMPGIYRISILIKSNNEILDLVESGISLHVESGDFYGTGRIYPNQRVKTLVEQSWINF